VTADRSERLFAVVPPGLEEVTLAELDQLGFRGAPEVGGVLVRTDRAGVHRLHLHARIPVRFWVRMGKVRARTLEQLAAGVRTMPWVDYVWPRQPLDVRVAATGSLLGRRDVVARKVEHAVRDALRVPRRERGKPATEPVAVLVRAEDDEIELSVDASGDRLHQRGWRRDVSEAPLRENLAAAVLGLVDWGPGEALVDPMCGSGTFPIEAATIAWGRPPGADRSFAFERWPSHDRAAWEATRAEPGPPPIPTPIVGGDADAEVIRAARANARRAGVEGQIELRPGDAREIRLPAPTGLVVVNPPWGGRIGDAPAAWRALGELLQERAAAWRVAVLCPDPALLRVAGLQQLPRVSTFSVGGIRIALHAGRDNRGRS
jgi:putative N6-adenine-specific DNA methylase